MSDWRPAILDLLALLSSPEKQLAYEIDVPIADVPDELLSMWFDDTYHPTDSAFQASFSPAELEALAAFHRIFESRKHDLPNNPSSIRGWLDTPAWKDVMGAASRTVATFGA